MALPAINVFDFDTIRAVSDAAVELNKPIFMQFSSSTVKYYGADRLKKLVFSSIDSSNRNLILLHLDHCTDFEIFKDCISHGWDSLMADFSHQSIDENIAKMSKLREMIKDRPIILEGELGQVAGVEDGFGSEGGSFVSTDDVEKFVSETNVELLAIGIGNAHGFYTNTDGIRIDLLKQIHQLVPNQKLVLHGGTGIEDIKINEMIDHGVYKINISTELKEAYLKSSELHASSDNRYNMIKLVDDRYQVSKELIKDKIISYSR